MNHTKHQSRRTADALGGRIGTYLIVLLCVLFVVVVGFWLGPMERADAIGLEAVVIAVLFGIVAIRAAVEHQHDLTHVLSKAIEHEDSLGTVRESIETVTGDAMRRMSEAIHTEPIGMSPDYFPAIVALLAKAKTSVRVLCDHPGYLIFSRGETFDEYFRVLREKIAGCTSTPAGMSVNLMFLAEPERRELHDHQFQRDTQSDAAWQAWRERESANHRDGDCETARSGRLPELWRRTALIAGCDDDQLPPDLSPEDLANRFVAVDNAIRDRYLVGAAVHDLKFRDAAGNPIARRNGPTVYFWICDENDPREAEAIFSIVPLGAVQELAREHGFATRDAKLIQALVGIFERYKMASTEDEDRAT
jgi:hypothetical protein